MPARLPRAVVLSAALAGLLLVGPAGAETRVYRCEEAGRVTYSDVPCPNAHMLNIDAGAAAPDARERLRRDQEALDQRAAARRDARARDDAMARMEMARAPETAPPTDAAPYDQVYDFAYPPLGALRGDRVRHHDGRDRERDKRAKSVITQPLPTPLRAHR